LWEDVQWVFSYGKSNENVDFLLPEMMMMMMMMEWEVGH